MCDPIFRAIDALKEDDTKVIMMTPSGKVFKQNIAYDLSKNKHLIILCGHYEGIDQRFIDECVDEEISIGDFVLTGGELPAMVIASVTNIGLDLLFVVVFHWGVVGAAAATVIAQLFAAFICLAALLKLDALRFEKGEFTFHGGDAKVLLRLALPMVFQNVMICGGGMALQTVINRQSFAFVAGFTASNKLYCVLEAAAVSFGYAITTYTGQNLGAKEYDRIRRGTKSALGICFLTSVLVAGLMFLIGRPSLSLFIASSADPSVMDVALRYLYTMSCTLPILYFLYVYRSALQGMGDTVVPMISGFVELAMRVGAALLLPGLLGEWGIYLAEIMAWAGAAVLLMWGYYYRIGKYTHPQ